MSGKILIVTSSLSGGGAENHILNLCRYLSGTSFTPQVMTISQSVQELEGEIARQGTELVRFPLDSLAELLLPGKISKLRRVARESSPDIIHAHLYHGEIVGAAAARMTGTPLVVTRHSSGLEFSGLRRSIVRRAEARIARIIAVSQGAAAEAVEMGFGSDIITVIPNGVDTSRFRPVDRAARSGRRSEWLEELFPGPVPEETVVVGSIGGLKAVKNHQLFLRAAARIIVKTGPETPPFRFVIVGEGPERAGLEALSAELGLEGRLAMPGFHSTPERILPLFDIFVLPSLTEGVPIALLEAMASGNACIASDVGGVADLLGDSGIVLPVCSEENLSDAILSFVVDRSRISEMGLRARDRAVRHYGLASWGGRTEAVYTEILRSRKR